MLDYTRCAMLPLRNPEGQTEHNADLETIGAALDPGALPAPIEGWDLMAFREAAPGSHFAGLDAEQSGRLRVAMSYRRLLSSRG